MYLTLRWHLTLAVTVWAKRCSRYHTELPAQPAPKALCWKSVTFSTPNIFAIMPSGVAFMDAG
jgi:hypothetical protein